MHFEKNCSTCHFVARAGIQCGTKPCSTGDKPAGDLLLAILDPNAVVEPRFVSYNIETKDGRSLSGIVSAETATTLTLSQAGGITENMLSHDIAEIRASGLSLMPEGFEQAMTPQDLADLIAYLEEQCRSRTTRNRDGGKCVCARAKFVAGGVNGFAKIISASEQLPYPSWLGTLPLAHCRQTDGKSKVSWQLFRRRESEIRRDPTISFSGEWDSFRNRREHFAFRSTAKHSLISMSH